jgi:hypothetical protein
MIAAHRRAVCVVQQSLYSTARLNPNEASHPLVTASQWLGPPELDQPCSAHPCASSVTATGAAADSDL